MNTFWLKIAGAVIAVILIFVLVLTFTSGSTEEPVQPEQPAKPKNFAQQVEADREKFSNLPQPVDTQDQNQTTVNVPETQTVQPVPAPPKPVEPITLYFKPMNETDEIEATRFYNVAVQDRSIGRLPGTGYKLMVDNCRRIIEKWPDSIYAYKSKQMMADLREQYKQRYNITPEEIDVSMYSKKREGTKPYND